MSHKRFFIIMLVLMISIAGCGTKQTQDTKAPDKAQVGIIDMNRAVKAHPKYSQLMELGKQADTLAAQLEAQQRANLQAQMSQPNSDIIQNEMTELNKASEQEFAVKMSAKEEEINGKIGTKVDALRRTLSDEMNEYNDQLEKEYQPQIFNLQLKLKTVQLAKEETASIQAELDKLHEQRSAALSAKQTELAARLDQLIAAEKAAAEPQLAAYAQQLNEQIAKQAGAKQAEIMARSNEKNQIAPQMDQAAGAIQQQLSSKQQEIEALQGLIIKNIKDKTAQVAVGSGYEAILINVAVNVNAVDITDVVIVECNK